MKKSFLILLPLLLAGCGESEANNNYTPVPGPEEHEEESQEETSGHTHSFSTEWSHSDTQHWHAATCEHNTEKLGLADHIDSDKNFICDVCDAETYVSVKELYIKKQPNKTTYYVGDVFDPTGMEVNIDFKDGTYIKTTDYSYSHEPLKLSDKEVVISWKQFTKSVSINVIEKQEIEDEYTCTISLHGSTFATNFPEGTNFDNEAKFEELFEYIDNQLEYYDLISKISCTKCATRKVDGDTFFQIGTGSPAKGKFNEGTFSYSSDVKIYKVEITAFNYSNPYEDWQTGQTIHNVDNLGHLILDDLDTSFEIAANAAPVTKTIVKEYAEGANGFTLKSTGGRMLVSEMKITWRG